MHEFYKKESAPLLISIYYLQFPDRFGLRRGKNRIFDIKSEAKMTFKELADWYLELRRSGGLLGKKAKNVD